MYTFSGAKRRWVSCSVDFLHKAFCKDAHQRSLIHAFGLEFSPVCPDIRAVHSASRVARCCRLRFVSRCMSSLAKSPTMCFGFCHVTLQAPRGFLVMGDLRHQAPGYRRWGEGLCQLRNHQKNSVSESSRLSTPFWFNVREYTQQHPSEILRPARWRKTLYPYPAWHCVNPDNNCFLIFAQCL